MNAFTLTEPFPIETLPASEPRPRAVSGGSVLSLQLQDVATFVAASTATSGARGNARPGWTYDERAAARFLAAIVPTTGRIIP